MKTFVYLIATCFIATGAYFSALNSANPVPGFAIAYGIWALFFWGWHNRWKKAQQHRRWTR